MIDFSLSSNKSCTVSDDILLIIQQIDILFDTDPNEVLGSEYFGTQYDRYLHNLKLSNENLKYAVLSDLNSLELFGYTPNVDVILLRGTAQDIALVNIKLSKDDTVYEKTYKIN